MKKKILFIFLRHSEKKEDSTLTKDISDEFKRQGHDITVVTLLEAKEGRETEYKREHGVKVLRVKTGNYFDSPGKIEKGITTLRMPHQLLKGIRKHLKKEKFDLIYTHTPFISNPYLITKLKKEYNAQALLHLWDIFPQNAKDIGLLRNKWMLKYFRRTEKKMYDSFDYIGCMSEGNEKYIYEKNIETKGKTFLLKNWAKPKPYEEVKKEEIREKYNLPKNKTIFVFGGNMGKPQKLTNILRLAEKTQDLDAYYLFVGKGTEQKELIKIKEERNLKNVRFINFVPREDYEKLIAGCDVGIVSLDERFTVPNFPSKTTDYFKIGLPILASLDPCAYDDYGNVLVNIAKGGKRGRAGNIEELRKEVIEFIENKEKREVLGRNGRKYYEEELCVEKAYKAIMDKIGE